MKILLDIGCPDSGLSEEELEGLAIFVLEHEGAPANSCISISLVTKDEIAGLNSKYRKKQDPTDVLSFPCDSAWDACAASAPELMLGDIMISPEIAALQAPGFGNGFAEEMRLLLVHGVLHLLGYDHVEDDEAVVMESHEREILSLWGSRQ